MSAQTKAVRAALFAAFAAGAVAAGGAWAQHRDPAFGEGDRVVDIVVENLHETQVFSPGVLAAHGPDQRFFQEGEAASLALKLLAEDGNTDPFMAEAQFGAGTAYGSATVFWLVPPKGRQSGVLRLSERFPLVSGATMIGFTNDGFVGLDSVAAWTLAAPVSIDLFPLDAGTEANTEAKADLGFLGGLDRPAEGLPVRRHPGVRGDADLEAKYGFDPSKPIARVTITPRRGS